MQYAHKNGVEVAIDSSLFTDPMAATQMTPIDKHVELKGSPKPVSVYRLSGSKLESVFRVMDNSSLVLANNKVVKQIQKYMNTERNRICVMITGVPFAGSTMVSQQAAALSNLVPFVHMADETAGLAQLASTMAMWYSHVDNDEVQSLAASVIEHMAEKRYSRAHDECVEMVNTAVDAGKEACFIVECIHFLDSFSLSILRECLQPRSDAGTFRRQSSRILRRSTSSSVSSEGEGGGKSRGKIVFLCTHISLCESKSPILGKRRCNSSLLNLTSLYLQTTTNRLVES